MENIRSQKSKLLKNKLLKKLGVMLLSLGMTLKTVPVQATSIIVWATQPTETTFEGARTSFNGASGSGFVEVVGMIKVQNGTVMTVANDSSVAVENMSTTAQGYYIRPIIKARASEANSGVYRGAIKLTFKVTFTYENGGSYTQTQSVETFNQTFYVGRGEWIETELLSPANYIGTDAFVSNVVITNIELGRVSESEITGNPIRSEEWSYGGGSGGGLTQEQWTQLSETLNSINQAVGGTAGSTEDLENKNSQIEDTMQTIAEYEQTEQELKNSGTENLKNWDMQGQTEIISSPNFIKTAKWVRDRYEEMVSGTQLETALLFSLFLGTAMWIIGRSNK